MGDRKRLPGLQAMSAVGLFVEECVGVVVETFDVGTGQQQKRIAGAPNIKIGYAVIENAAIVTHGNGRFGAFTAQRDSLHSEEYLRRTVPASRAVARVVAIERLIGHNQLETRSDGQLHD